MIVCDLVTKTVVTDLVTTRYCYDRVDYIKIKKALDIPWSELFENRTVEEMWYIFIGKLKDIINIHVPVRKYHRNKKYVLWNMGICPIASKVGHVTLATSPMGSFIVPYVVLDMAYPTKKKRRV